MRLGFYELEKPESTTTTTTTSSTTDTSSSTLVKNVKLTGKINILEPTTTTTTNTEATSSTEAFSNDTAIEDVVTEYEVEAELEDDNASSSIQKRETSEEMKLGFDDIDLMYEMCRFGKAIEPDSTSVWCAIFSQEDLEVAYYHIVFCFDADQKFEKTDFRLWNTTNCWSIGTKMVMLSASTPK